LDGSRDAKRHEDRLGWSLGDVLAAWRRARGRSQMDTALAAGLSPRQLSFIETGRARPGAATLAALCDELAVPQDHHAWLLALPEPGRTDPSGAAAPFPEALDRLLKAEETWPRVLKDSGWTVIRANHPARCLFSHVFGAGLGDGLEGANILALLGSDPGRSRLANWPDVMRDLLLRVRLELTQGAKADLPAQIRALLAADAPSAALWDGLSPLDRPDSALRYDFQPPAGPGLSMIAVVTALGPAHATGGYRMDALHPADDATVRRFTRLCAANKQDGGRR